MATRELTATLDIDGMTCASCVRRVERALGKVPGVETANVNFASETAYVTTDGSVTQEALVAAVEGAGYAASISHGEDRTAAKEEQSRRTLMLLVFGAVLGVPVIVLSMAMDIAGIFPTPGWYLSTERAARWWGASPWT